MKTSVLKLRKRAPERSKLKEAAEILRRGGVVVIPTDTVYGLAAGAFVSDAQKKIYRLKGRSYRKPLIVMPPDIASLECLVEIPRDARTLMEKIWPGPLTVVLPVTPLGRMVMGGRADAGARIPAHPVARALLDMCGFPLLTTSANPSGKASAKSAREALRYFGGKVEALIDAGPSDIGRESTVLDMVRFPYVVIREGCLPSKQLLKYI